MKTKIMPIFAVLIFASIFLLNINLVSAEGDFDYDLECSNLDIIADGVGMGTGSGTINLNVPGEPELSLLYWALRGTEDANIKVDGNSIVGNLIKPPVTTQVWWSHAYSYVFDFTDYVSEGANSWSLTGLNPGFEKDPSAAAAFVVYEDETVENIIQIKSISDFSYVGLSVPLNQSPPVNFEFEAVNENRTAKVILAVGDAEPLPRTDRIWYQTGVGVAPSYIIGTGDVLAENQLRSANGLEADVFEASVTIPAGNEYLSIQLESPVFIQDPWSDGDSLILISAAMALECELEEPCEKCSNGDNWQAPNYCEPIWKCGGWSECNDGVQTRNCEDQNSCEFSYNQPFETIGCEEVQVLEDEQKTNFVLWFLLGILILLILILLILGVV